MNNTVSESESATVLQQCCLVSMLRALDNFVVCNAERPSLSIRYHIFYDLILIT
jgi:hypothetical protein